MQLPPIGIAESSAEAVRIEPGKQFNNVGSLFLWKCEVGWVLTAVPKTQDFHQPFRFVDAVENDVIRQVHELQYARSPHYQSPTPGQGAERQGGVNERITQASGRRGVLLGQELRDGKQVPLGLGGEVYLVVPP